MSGEHAAFLASGFADYIAELLTDLDGLDVDVDEWDDDPDDTDWDQP